MATLFDMLSAELVMLARLLTMTAVLTRYAVPVSELRTVALSEDVIVAAMTLAVGSVVSGTVVSTVKGGIVSVLLSFPSESLTVIVQSS
jgi:hypothetical protein